MKPEYIGIGNFDTNNYAYAYCKCPLPMDYAIKWPLIKDGKLHRYSCTCEDCETEVGVLAKSGEDKIGDTAKLSSGGPLLVDQYNHIEGKKVPLIHTDKEKRLIEEANQRIRKSQVEQAKGAIRSANFIAK